LPFFLRQWNHRCIPFLRRNHGKQLLFLLHLPLLHRIHRYIRKDKIPLHPEEENAKSERRKSANDQCADFESNVHLLSKVSSSRLSQNSLFHLAVFFSKYAPQPLLWKFGEFHRCGLLGCGQWSNLGVLMQWWAILLQVW
jgi:hypothetical protein